MIQRSDHDLIARFQFPSDRTRNGKGQTGHVGTESNFISRAAEKVRHALPRSSAELIGQPAGFILAAAVRIAADEVVAHPSNHRSRYLRARRPIQEDRRLPAHAAAQRGKVAANRVDVESIE
jgi:hypothetical protein